MAAHPLILSPLVRPWLKAGLGALLLDSPEQAQALRLSPAARCPENTAQQTSRPARHSLREGASPRPGPSSSRQPTDVPPPGPEADTSKSRARRANAAPKNTDAFPAPVWPPEHWPAAWLALKNRRPLPPRPLVFWTYEGLGDDLMGIPDQARQQIIVRMLTALKHPGGTHVFWPFALPGYTPDADAPSLFWSGAALMRPRALLLFGSEARDILSMPKTLVPYCQERIDGRLVIQLPKPATLAQDEGAFSRAQVFLARMLNFCAARRD